MTTPATATAERAAVPSPADNLTTVETTDKKIWRVENHLLRPEDVDALCAHEFSGSGGIVAGLIPKRAVSFLIGDSGLGKSPLAYQLGLSVAAGIPFLAGMETEQGPVVYLDYENGLQEGREVRQQLVRFLELPDAPRDFYVWTPDQSELKVESLCQGKPKLVIVDSMRSHDPHFEKGEHAGEKMKQLNDLARKHGVAILVIHHTRKPGENGVPRLDAKIGDGKDAKDTPLMLWLKETAGHSSIINQSHTRIAVDSPDGRSSKAEAALVLRWHRRIRGEAGPLYLERVCDGDGEALGYRRIADVALLGNPDQTAAFDKLSPQFTFKEAKGAYSKTDDPTRKFLVKCIQLGLIRQTGRGLYERLG
jgi:hypothetical protein